MIDHAELLASSRPTPSAASLGRVVDEWPTVAEIARVLTFQSGFNTTVVTLGTTLFGLAAGVVGVFALLRKRAMVADALSHATLPGVGLAFVIAVALGESGKSLPILLIGAGVTAAIGAACIQAILRFTRLHGDAAIGIVLSVGFGVGVVVLSYVQSNTPAGAAGLKGFIYGQTAAMGVHDAVIMGATAAVTIALIAIFFKEFALVCFNDAFARVDGMRVGLVDFGIMVLVVVVTVAGLQAVGLLLVIAMLIIPPVAARFWTERLWLMVVVAGAIGAMSGYLGASISALLPRKPAGAVIVLLAGAIFALSLLLAPRRGVLAAVVRRVGVRIRIAADHALEAAFEGRHEGVAMRSVLASVAHERGWPGWLTPVVSASLRRRGLATGSGASLECTEAGLSRGAVVCRNHALWTQYLVSHADVASSHVDWSVDQVEHVLSGQLIAELESELRSRGVPVPEVVA